MVAKKPGRYLAPVALIAVAVAVGLIVHARVQSHRPVKAPVVHRLTKAARDGTSKPAFYVIKPGDSLSTISVKTGVSIAELQSLNPRVNPGALQAGQRLRLRP